MTIKTPPTDRSLWEGFCNNISKRKLIYFFISKCFNTACYKKYRGDNNTGHKHNSLNIGIHADIGSPVRKIHGLYSDLSGAKN